MTHKWVWFTVVGLLVCSLLAACQQQPDSLAGYDRVYLVPAGEVEPFADPAAFQAQGIGVTNSWEAVAELAAQKQLKALIIHHAAAAAVNTEQLADWFANDSIVVAAIGIKGDTLADMVGQPALYPGPWLRPEEYETNDFFYIYQAGIDGNGVTSESFRRADVAFMLSALNGFLPEDNE